MISVNDEQSQKVFSSIEVNEDGETNEICFNDLHPLNAFSPIEVTEDGIVIRVKELQKDKAKIPIEVTESGIEINFNDLHS